MTYTEEEMISKAMTFAFIGSLIGALTIACIFLSKIPYADKSMPVVKSRYTLVKGWIYKKNDQCNFTTEVNDVINLDEEDGDYSYTKTLYLEN